MIPYEELVVALQAWRAKRGLPVGQLSGAPPPAPATARAQPPAPPRAPSQLPANSIVTQPGVDPVTDNYRGLDHSLAAEAHVDSEQDVEEVGEHEYANEGDDFALAFQNLEADGEGESTAIGSAPAPSAAQPAAQRRRNDDW
jgi:hypothetical protein